MRWYILRTLLHKEALRHATNRGGLFLAALLITGAMLLSVLNVGESGQTSLVGGIHHCFIHSEEEGPWLKHLQNNIPTELRQHLVFRKLPTDLGENQRIEYPTGTGAIQIRLLNPSETGRARYRVSLRHPDGDRFGMFVYETWFWRESYRYWFQEAARARDNPASTVPLPEIDTDPSWLMRRMQADLQNQMRELLKNNTQMESDLRPLAVLEIDESPLSGSSLDTRAAIATALVMFGLFFTCVYLMPSLTCEERERGLLLAQALSPASAIEILAAKFLFYPVFGIILATILAGIHNPSCLSNGLFWITLFVLAVGSLGIGMSVASIAKSQRSASMGSLCYMLAVALVLLVCQQNNLTFISQFALEYHAPNLLHAILTNQVRDTAWTHLLMCGLLSVCWVFAATILFRKRGWQ
jgi:hypothetical protein